MKPLATTLGLAALLISGCAHYPVNAPLPTAEKALAAATMQSKQMLASLN
jgi:hypothetical protein